MRNMAMAVGACWLMGMAAPVLAVDSPEQLVQGIYDSFGKPAAEAHYWLEKLMAPEARRHYFTPEIVRLLESADNDMYCLEAVQAADGNTFDEHEIQRTLVLESRDVGERRHVDARFTHFGRPNHLRYEFAPTPDGWRVADIAAPAPEGSYWRLSEFRCAP